MYRLKTFGFSILCVLVLAVYGWQANTAAAANHDHKHHPDADQKKAKPQARIATDFTLADLDGKEISLSDYKGKYVILEWFNYDCPFVVYHYETVTTMVDIAKNHKDNNVHFLSINSTNYQTVDDNKKFAEKHGMFWPILDDRAGKVGRAYDAKRTPQMFIIDPNGVILYEGAIDNAPLGKVPDGQEKVNYVEKALSEILAGEPVSTPRTKEYGCTVKYGK